MMLSRASVGLPRAPLYAECCFGGSRSSGLRLGGVTFFVVSVAECRSFACGAGLAAKSMWAPVSASSELVGERVRVCIVG